MSTHTPETTMQAVQSFIVDPSFPCAPEGWSVADAEHCAKKEGLVLVNDHWEVIHFLQQCLTCETHPHGRQLHDMMEEHFHTRGGLRHLYEIFPKGPVAQGCRIAGLVPPAGSIDKSFGTVQ